MWAYREESEVEELQGRLEEQLGRKLTPREKFYIALSEACLSRHNGSSSDTGQSSDSNNLKAA
jgi:hypothetical protein